MDPQVAAQGTLENWIGELDAEEPDLPIRDPDGKTKSHAHWMLIGLREGYVKGDKAHRWLGYAQAIIVSHGHLSLNDMKEINRDS